MVRYLEAEEREELLKIDLMQYGDHQDDCAIRDLCPYVRMCDCGWADIEIEHHYAADPVAEWGEEPEEQGEY